MKTMLETNVLISAFVFGGKMSKLLSALLKSEHEILVSEYVDTEFKNKLESKWTYKAERTYLFYHQMPFTFLRKIF